MKRFYYIAIVFLLIILPSSYGHQESIVDENNKKSLKINICNEVYYGYHAIFGDYHFHQVQWDNNLEKWIIINSDDIYTNNPCADELGEKKLAKLDSCIDGDTVKLIIEKEVVSVRLLAVDTPELTSADQEIKDIAIKAKNFVCEVLSNSKNIYYEYDLKSSKLDKYGRHLVWLFTDQGLLQEALINNGYAKVAYIYARYKYIPLLQIKEEIAATNKFGIWQYNNLINDNTSSKKEELTQEEKIEKIVYVTLVIVFTIVAVVKEITKK